MNFFFMLYLIISSLRKSVADTIPSVKAYMKNTLNAYFPLWTFQSLFVDVLSNTWIGILECQVSRSHTYFVLHV